MERTDFEQWKAREVARLLALVETERRYYQDMVAALPVALVVLSSDRGVVSSNRAFRQSFRLRTEDLRHKTIDEILPSPQLIEKIRDAHMQGVSRSSVLLELDGRPFRVAVVPIRSWEDEGEAETLLMLEEVVDVPETRAAPPPISARRAPDIAGLDIPAIVWQADASTLRFTSVSGAAEQLLGYPVSHWLNTAQFFRERIHPDDRDATMAFYEAMMTQAGDASAEYRAVPAGGEAIWCRETIRVPPAGAAKRVITGVITDISRRKQMEEQFLTAERTDALHGLASRLSHDLNNPLMIITGYAEEMLHGLAPQHPMRADVQYILTATERISAITSQLLAFTRKLANPPQTVDLSRILAGLEDKIAKAAGVAVELVRAAQPILASADPVQLEEVMLALVSSAREDAQQRSRLTVSCDIHSVAEQVPAATLKPGTYARVLIQDDSRGADQSRKHAGVFESALPPKDPEKNAGPALARAYALVREWGGDIAFTSDPHRGGTFVVYLPYRGAEVPREAAPRPAIAPTVPPERETILLVEDEGGIRALIRKILLREGYQVLEAASGEEAVNVLARRAGHIDLLVTDVMLPGMSGRDVAERTRKAFPDVKVLYVSGYTEDEQVRAGAFPPGSRFLQKPFTLAALVGTVREALGGR